MTEIATEIIDFENADEHEADQTNSKLSVSLEVRENSSVGNEKSRSEDRYGRYEVLSSVECEAETNAENKRRMEAIEQAMADLDAAETGRYVPERSYVLKCFTLEQANAVLTRFAAKTGIQFTLLGKYGEVGLKSEPKKRAELDANAKRLHFKSARVDYDGCAHALLAEEYFVCRCGVAERSWSYMHAPETDLVRRFQHRKTCLKQRLKRQLGITANRASRIPPEKRRELDRRLENEWQMRLETYRQTGEVNEEEYAALVAANTSHRRTRTSRHSAGKGNTPGTSSKRKGDADDSSSINPDADESGANRDASGNERNIFIYITQIFRFPQYRLLEDTPNARSRLFAALRNDWLMPASNVIGECIYIVRLPPLTNHQHTLTERQLRSQLSSRTDIDVGMTDQRSRVVRPVDKRGIPRWVGERVYFTVSEDVIQFIRRLLLEEHVQDDYAIQQRIKQRFVTRHGYAPTHGDYYNYPTRPLIRHYMRKYMPNLFADENDTLGNLTASQRRSAGASTEHRSLELYAKKKRPREFVVDSSLNMDNSFTARPPKLEPTTVRTPNINMLRVARRDAPASAPQAQTRTYRVSEPLAKKRNVGESITITQEDHKSFVGVGETITNVDVYSYPEEPDENDVQQVETAEGEGEGDGEGGAVSYAYVSAGDYDYGDADPDAEAEAAAATDEHGDPHATTTIEYSSALEIVD